mmetsp:Transcript_8418/g.1123  ORF Transcript_8418/g.1123 Transcript_8418/m.1123 type:complete len:88 (-) Transcript_8418:52-315(-)
MLVKCSFFYFYKSPKASLISSLESSASSLRRDPASSAPDSYVEKTLIINKVAKISIFFIFCVYNLFQYLLVGIAIFWLRCLNYLSIR